MQIPIIPVSDGTTQRLIANIQENTVANQDYYRGDQFILNGVLYKVTKVNGGTASAITPAITQGATIDITNDCVVSDTITQQMKPQKLAEITATTSMTYKQALDALGNNTTVLSNLDEATRTRLVLVVGAYYFVITQYASSGIAFDMYVIGNHLNLRSWFIGFNSNSSAKTYTSSSSSVIDDSSNNISSSFAGTWAIYLV